MLQILKEETVAAALCATALLSCTNSRTLVVEHPSPAGAAPAALEGTPVKRDPTIPADFIDRSVFRPLLTLLNPPGLLRTILGGNKVEAYNVTAEDDVASSTWFTHRNARQRMTPEAVRRGANRGPGPSTSGIWRVIGAKVGGVTPGFTIRDATGTEYRVKFDPSDYLELTTAAEVISSRLFYAAGYNTPELYIAVIDPSKIKAAESLTFKDPLGRSHRMHDEDIQEFLRPVPRRPDGRVRVVASLNIPEGIGPFSYEGTRDDDPADTIPHQHRRELRGLYVMATWLNHWDMKQHNSLDAVVEENGRKYIRHYLIDFGATLGSRTRQPNTPREGTEFDLDLSNIGARLLTGGFYAAAWERFEYEIEYSSIGYYANEPLDPGSYRTNYPNPAFRQRTIRDSYWGAKLVASFTEEQIRDAVSAGELSDPAAAEALTRAILARQEKTVRYWFLRVTPLEELAITGAAGGPARVAVGADGPSLTFTDLAVAEGLVPAPSRRYEMRFEFPAAGIKLQDVVKPSISPEGRGELALPTPSEAGSDLWNRLQSRPIKERLAKLELRAIPGPGQPKPRSVRIYLYPDQNRGYRVVGRAY